jgi:predicted ATP-grasp superfamily ATP-dependent carboligase
VAAKFAPPLRTVSHARCRDAAPARREGLKVDVGSMLDRPAIIVVANSARALASSAKRAGFAPLSIDVFGDDDTREASLATVKLEGGLSDGLTLGNVAAAVEMLISAYEPIGLVYGAGFERRPETIAAIARKTRILGNEAEALKRAKDPLALARLCAAIGVSHPPVMFAAPAEPDHWLVKRRGGAGGAHIAAATDSRPLSPDCYFQRRVTGQAISALFVANGEKAAIIGLSVQWTSPTPASPFRYGGAAGPTAFAVPQAEEIGRAVASITSELGLVGLNSVDFLVSCDAVWVIEINPRPGATLDVFEPNEDALFAYHVAACQGRLTPVPMGSACKAAEIVYAPCDMVSRAERNWPDWAVDRPSPGTRIAAGDPLCTTLASGATVDLARNCAKERAQRILADIQESGH